MWMEDVKGIFKTLDNFRVSVSGISVCSLCSNLLYVFGITWWFVHCSRISLTFCPKYRTILTDVTSFLCFMMFDAAVVSNMNKFHDIKSLSLYDLP